MVQLELDFGPEPGIEVTEYRGTFRRIYFATICWCRHYQLLIR